VELYKRQERHDGRESLSRLIVQESLGLLLVRTNRQEEGLELLQQTAADFRRLLGPDHVEQLRVQSNLASALVDAKRYEEAEALVRQAAPRMRQTHGDDHPMVLQFENHRLSSKMRQLQFAEAEPLSADILARARRGLPKGHHVRNLAYANHAAILLGLGRIAEAQQVTLEAALEQKPAPPTTPEKPPRKSKAGGKP
jgi:tetratricopeptide (TPR) repeat protein